MAEVIIISADKEIIELAVECGHRVVGVIDKNPEANALGYPILGSDEDWMQLRAKYQGVKIIMALDPTAIKQRVAQIYRVENLLTLISSDVYISSSSTIGHGCIIQRGVKIFSSAQIGVGCKINVNTTIHHDTFVGNYCTLAPGSQLLGAVRVEDRVFVGASAILLPKVKIGSDVIVGAGAVVLNDVEPQVTVAGVPARILHPKELR